MKLLVLLLIIPSVILSQKYMIKNPHVMDSISVSRYDVSNRLTYEQAKIACKELGEGWRLPTKQEMIKICENKNIQGYLPQLQLVNDTIYYEDEGLYYWTNEEYGPNHVWIFCRDESYFAITLKNEYLYVRPVRTN